MTGRWIRRLAWIALVTAACSGKNKPPAPGQPTPPPTAPAPEAVPTLKLGVIVSRTSTPAMRQYGEAIIEGVRIAATEHETAGTHHVELIIRDDSGKALRAAALTREIEAQGAVAIIGPTFEAALNAAAAARTNVELVLVAPALTEPLRQPNTYALNREDSAGAVLLGRYAASLKRRTGVLHERGGLRSRDVAAFVSAYTAAGGMAPTVVSYNTGTTTFAAEIRRLRDARAQLLFLPLSARDIQQVVPQLGYYGLDGVQLLGGEAWTSEPLRKALMPALFDGVIVATVLPRSSNEVGWQAFETAYQQTYKRSLQSPLPAVGYDAAQIVLSAAPRGRVSVSAIARAIPRLGPVRGATGLLRITTGAVSRTAFLLRFRNGAWEPVVFTGAS